MKAATGGPVARLSYISHDSAKTEAVRIIYENGESQEVNISTDSLLAIARDVLKVV